MRAAVALAAALLVAGCTLDAPQGVEPTPTPQATPSIAPGPPPVPEPRFEGARAMEHVVWQVTAEDGGPRYRVPGTAGNREVATRIGDTLTPLGYTVALHNFTARYGCEDVAMHNVVAERPGTSGRIVAFGAHYDTRPVADKDPAPSARGDPILGANDGASGVAVLLELARVLPASDDAVRLLFFDGEDGGGSWGGPGCRTDWILGSRAYAESLSDEEIARFRAFVLVDMVGDPALQLPREGYSAADPRGRPLQDAIYAVAGGLGHAQFLDLAGPSIIDDHVPFLDRLVPAVDLIHLVPNDARVFPAWHHTHDDDLDVVSPESLAAVGRTLEAWFAETALTQSSSP